MIQQPLLSSVTNCNQQFIQNDNYKWCLRKNSKFQKTSASFSISKNSAKNRSCKFIPSDNNKIYQKKKKQKEHLPDIPEEKFKKAQIVIKVNGESQKMTIYHDSDEIYRLKVVDAEYEITRRRKDHSDEPFANTIRFPIEFRRKGRRAEFQQSDNIRNIPDL